MTLPRISIITPSYNQGQFIEQTIDSVLSQGYTNLEYFIIDGGSTDHSVEIIKKYERHLAGWISERDEGQSHAINKGLTRSNGRVFNWINSDDYLSPGALLKIGEAFQNPETNMYCGRSNIVDALGKVLRQSRGTDIFHGNLLKTIGQARIDQPETWWRKTVLDQIGPLNQALHYTMDRDWWIKYLLRYGLGGVRESNEVLVNFRLHESSKTVSLSSAFNQERNSYYYSLAQYYRLDTEAQILNELANTKAIDLDSMPIAIDKEKLSSALAYLFLQLADEAYVSSDFTLVKAWLSKIPENKLSREDQIFKSKLAFRSSLPKSLISLARKLRN